MSSRLIAMYAFAEKFKQPLNTLRLTQWGFLVENPRGVWGEIWFLDSEPDVSRLKNMLTSVTHQLVIVDRALLLGAGEITGYRPLWVQILHAVYYGRVYCYDENGISAMHLEYQGDGEYIASYCPEPIDVSKLKPREIDCLHSQFQQHVKTMMFGEVTWWKTGSNRTYEQKQQHAKQEQPRQRRYMTTLDEYLQILELAEIPPKTALKAQYRKLALQWHPDVCRLPEAEDKMKAINAAYAYVLELAR